MLKPYEPRPRIIHCDLPNNKVHFRWGKKELEVIRERDGVITIRANTGGRLSVNPIVSNVVEVKIVGFF